MIRFYENTKEFTIGGVAYRRHTATELIKHRNGYVDVTETSTLMRKSSPYSWDLISSHFTSKQGNYESYRYDMVQGL